MDYHSIVCYNFLFSDVAPGLRCVRGSLWPLAAVYLVRLIIKCAETVVQLQTECTVLVLRMVHRKWKETKQQPGMLPGPALPDCSLVSFHILWAMMSTSTVRYRNKTRVCVCKGLEKDKDTFRERLEWCVSNKIPNLFSTLRWSFNQILRNRGIACLFTFLLPPVIFSWFIEAFSETSLVLRRFPFLSNSDLVPMVF